MKSAPCKGCTRRHTACHDSCGDYIHWKEELRAGKERNVLMYQPEYAYIYKRKVKENA